MKRTYIRPAIKFLACLPLVMQAASPNSQSKMDDQIIDDKTNPDPSDSRSYDNFRWDDDD